MKVALVANTAWYIHNFRSNLIAALQRQGHEVVAIGGGDGYESKLIEAGARWRHVGFTGAGLHPWREWRCVTALRSALRSERVDVVLTYTPKGTIYTGLALTGLRARMIANISGLGRSFIVQGWLPRLVRLLYRVALRRADPVFFQNEADRQAFVAGGLVAASRTRRIPGSGVDLERFARATVWPALPAEPGRTVFLMVGRLMWEKGVGEYVAAARAARQMRPDLRFLLLGPLDPSPQRGVPASTLKAWIDEGVVEHLGTTDDVRPYLAAADCVVLPSYREGVPRALLEAAAMGRPLIAADSVGCRDCVEDGQTGLVARTRDADHLAECILNFAAMPLSERERMGLRGRAKMEREFDETIVLDAYLAAIAH
jgi:glycosyltransferase involved in cell wall biosynthesis